MNIVMHFLLNINKRYYGSTSIRLSLLWDTLVDSLGLGRAAVEFILGRNIFLISLFKGREILDGSNIVIVMAVILRVNWCVFKTWVLQVSGKWT